MLPRLWGPELSISHAWLQKLVRKFTTDSSQMWRLQGARGDPHLADLSRARDHTEQMKQHGELRLSRREKMIQRLLS